MKIKKTIVALCLLPIVVAAPISVMAATAAPTATTTQTSMDSLIKVNMVSMTVTKDSTGKEILEPTKNVTPGQILEYKTTYNNTSNMPAKDLIIMENIPVGTSYVDQSSVSPLKGKLEVSMDGGKTWSVPPIYQEQKNSKGKMEKVEVKPANYKALRWVLSDTLAAGKSATFSYRVQVNV